MGLSVMFVSGPRKSGKSSVIRAMIDRLWRIEPHYIRLVEKNGPKPPVVMPEKVPEGCGVASADCIEYEPRHVFEVIPDALAAIHRRDRFGAVIIEADGDAHLRSAYPYDHRVFVMPAPATVREVFRSPKAAAAELERILADTASFASGIFGLLRDEDCDDTAFRFRPAPLDGPEMARLLHTPLGDEIATRIALQPGYHGLVESEIILMNAVVSNGHVSQDCIQRIERLMERLVKYNQNGCQLFRCDPIGGRDQESKLLFKSLQPMCQGGR